MKLWTTEIKAIRPSDGELITYCGPNVPGLTATYAQEYCELNGLGYCKVIGQLICEIDEVTGETIHYDQAEDN